MVLQVTPSKSVSGVIKYFKDHLRQGDYLASGLILPAVWEGPGAERLGIAGQEVDLATFAALKANLDPRVVSKEEIERRVKEVLRPPDPLDLDKVKMGTQVRVPDRGEGRIVALDGSQAEVRLKDGKTRGETVFVELDELRAPARKFEIHKGERLTPRARQVTNYDFTFSTPKGVSVLWAATGDARIAQAFSDAVKETMEEVNTFALTRVRRGSGDNQMRDNRRTAELTWTRFFHGTARPIQQPDGTTVDPHLHCHVTIDTFTWDGVEERHKALNARAMADHAEYFQERCDVRLAQKLWEIGFDVDRRGKSFDIIDITPEEAAAFSGRTKEINALAQRLGITSDKAKGELGAKSRAAKGLAKDIDLAQHVKDRAPALHDRLQRCLKRSKKRAGRRNSAQRLSPKQRAEIADIAVSHALEDALERQSTANYARVAAVAARIGVGHGLTIEDLDAAFAKREEIIWGDPNENERILITTQQIVVQERTLLKRVREGRDTKRVLIRKPRLDEGLTQGQKDALTHVFASRDATMAIRGVAGTGKTTLLKTLDKELRRKRYTPVALAPTAFASRNQLCDAGFKEANTLAKFLGRSEVGATLRKRAKNGVIILDEAGMASVQDLLRLQTTADALKARVILVGDSKQMPSVERGDALRLLEDHGLPTAELTEILRQRKNPTYLAIVEKMAEGEAAEGLRMAKKAGYVRHIEVDESLDPIERLAKADQAAAAVAADLAVQARKDKVSHGVVCPTHALGRVTSAAIRKHLQAEGFVGPDAATLTLLRPVNRTVAARQDAAHTLEHGDVAVMVRDDRDRGLAKGERLYAKADKRGKMHLHRDNWLQRRVTQGLDARAYNVYRPEEIAIAVGDQVMALEAIPAAGLERKEVDVIKRISTKRRTITLESGKKVSFDTGHLGLGYAGTAQQLQGGSFVRNTFLGMTSALPAINKKTLYVGNSRGKERLVIITDDFDALEERVAYSSDRRHGIEVAKQAYRRALQAIDAELAQLDQDAAARVPGPFEHVVPKAERTREAPEPPEAPEPTLERAPDEPREGPTPPNVGEGREAIGDRAPDVVEDHPQTKAPRQPSARDEPGEALEAPKANEVVAREGPEMDTPAEPAQTTPADRDPPDGPTDLSRAPAEVSTPDADAPKAWTVPPSVPTIDPAEVFSPEPAAPERQPEPPSLPFNEADMPNARTPECVDAPAPPARDEREAQISLEDRTVEPAGRSPAEVQEPPNVDKTHAPVDPRAPQARLEHTAVDEPVVARAPTEPSPGAIEPRTQPPPLPRPDLEDLHALTYGDAVLEEPVLEIRDEAIEHSRSLKPPAFERRALEARAIAQDRDRHPQRTLDEVRFTPEDPSAIMERFERRMTRDREMPERDEIDSPFHRER